MDLPLFAYGTLQPGLAPPAVRPRVDRLVLMCTGRAIGTLYDLGEYPAAVFDGGGTNHGVVHGRVYRLPDDPAVLAALDEYEGLPDLYVRVAVPVRTTGGDLTCWAYQYNRDPAGYPRIPSGTYTPNRP